MKTYIASRSCIFKESNGEWGIFSNFYKLLIQIAGIKLKNTEYLYQLLRFGHKPELQQGIIDITNTLWMKRRAKSKKYMTENHPEFEANKLEIMEWIVRLKCAQHFSEIEKILKKTNKRAIVESSKRDNFWGAIPSQDGQILIGENHLGRIWIKIRKDMEDNPKSLKKVPTPNLPFMEILGNTCNIEY